MGKRHRQKKSVNQGNEEGDDSAVNSGRRGARKREQVVEDQTEGG